VLSLPRHFEGDGEPYRTPQEVEDWKKKDPIPKFRQRLVQQGLVTDAEAAAIDQQVTAEVKRLRILPATVLSQSLAKLWSMSSPKEDEMGTREISLSQAVAEAIGQEMERDSGVLSWERTSLSGAESSA